MKTCQIFKTKKNYKIVTLYQQESWAYLHSKPIHILPIEIENEELLKIILSSLEESRKIYESEEAKFWLGKDLLKLLNESSFNSLYKKSKSCLISISENYLIIEPQIFIGNDEGLVTDKNNKISFSIIDEKDAFINSIQQW